MLFTGILGPARFDQRTKSTIGFHHGRNPGRNLSQAKGTRNQGENIVTRKILPPLRKNREEITPHFDDKEERRKKKKEKKSGATQGRTLSRGKSRINKKRDPKKKGGVKRRDCPARKDEESGERSKKRKKTKPRGTSGSGRNVGNERLIIKLRRNSEDEGKRRFCVLL